jgi:hypothetical protein
LLGRHGEPTQERQQARQRRVVVQRGNHDRES